MLDNNKDRLFDFLKDKMENHNEEEWSTPPDFVFDKAMKQLDKKREDRTIFMFKRSLKFLLAFVVLGVFVLQYVSIQNTKKQLDVISTQLNHKDNVEDSDMESSALLVNEDTAEESTVVNSETTEVVLPTNHRSVSNPSYSGVSKVLFPSATSVNSTFADQNLGQIFSKSTMTQPVSNVSNNMASVMTKRDHLLAVNSLPLIGSHMLLAERSFDPALSVEHINTPKKDRFSLGVFATQNFSSFAMNGRLSSDNITLTEYDNNYVGYGVEINAAYDLGSKFSLNLRPSYQYIRNQSRMKESGSMDFDNVIVDGMGDLHYQTMMNMESPVGSNMQEIMFRVSDSMTEDSSMESEVLVNQRFHVIGLNLNLRYDLFSSEKIAMYSTAGFGYNRIFKVDNQYSAQVMVDNVVAYTGDMTVEHLEECNMSYTSYNFGLGLDVLNGTDGKLSVFGNYQRSLSSIRASISPAQASTYLEQFVFGLGYTKSF